MSQPKVSVRSDKVGPEAITKAEPSLPVLYSPIALRRITLRNRIVVSPMCMYSAGLDGEATDFHLGHLVRFALGGAGAVIVEATAVSEPGRITHNDLGIYADRQIGPLRRLTDAIRAQGAAPGIQLNHSGRKGSARVPWDAAGPLDSSDADAGKPPWTTIGPSAVPAPGRDMPREMSRHDIKQVIGEWKAATGRAHEAGFDIVEIHGGHGYLIHQFLSPHSNLRTDEYGCDLGGRMRFALEVANAVREAWPTEKPLFFRISAVDGADGSWTLEESTTLSRELGRRGVDVIDCSAGGLAGLTGTNITPSDYGFQVPYAAAVRRDSGLKTMAVGLIVEAKHAESILRAGHADLIAIARGFLANPNWALDGELKLTGKFRSWPKPIISWLERRAETIRTLEASLQEQGGGLQPHVATPKEGGVR